MMTGEKMFHLHEHTCVPYNRRLPQPVPCFATENHQPKCISEGFNVATTDSPGQD